MRSSSFAQGLMHRSIQNFNIPPWAYPGHLTVDCAQGGGNLNIALEGWGIWSGFISCSDVIHPWGFFIFLQGDVGYLNGFFAPRGENLNEPIFKNSNAQGGGGVELSNWSGHITLTTTNFNLNAALGNIRILWMHQKNHGHTNFGTKFQPPEWVLVSPWETFTTFENTIGR